MGGEEEEDEEEDEDCVMMGTTTARSKAPVSTRVKTCLSSFFLSFFLPAATVGCCCRLSLCPSLLYDLTISYSIAAPFFLLP